MINMKCRHNLVTHALTGCAIIIFLLASSIQSVIAQQPASDHRTKTQIHHQLFQDGLENVRKDGNRLQAIDTLIELTIDFEKKGDFDSRISIRNSRVVREIFSLAKDDSEIQQHLLNIIGNPSTFKSSHRTACELLVYVADDQARKFMLIQLKQEWPYGRWSHCFDFFKDVGDVDFLQWMVETFTIPEDLVIGNKLVDQYFRCIRMHQNHEDLLDYMVSEHNRFDRVWALNQAIRYSVDIELIRSKILNAIHKFSDNYKYIKLYSGLMRQCDKLGIFQSEDDEELSMIRKVINLRVVCGGGERPKWAAETIKAKRAVFYRFTRVTAENSQP